MVRRGAQAHHPSFIFERSFQLEIHVLDGVSFTSTSVSARPQITRYNDYHRLFFPLFLASGSHEYDDFVHPVSRV